MPFPAMVDRRPRARWRLTATLVACAALAAACASAAPQPAARPSSWSSVTRQANGQTVSLWMYGGSKQGNSYVDDVLAPAAAKLGVTLRRVPVADTQDALNRMLSELQAGRDHGGSVDLVWVNGENFRTGAQAHAWRCGWTGELPNMRYVDPHDPLLTHDFGVPVDGCEAPWSKAQFVLAYDAAEVAHPPTSMQGLFAWVKAHPGRFTYPAPPDFTGSAFLRQALYAVAGGPDEVPDRYDASTATRVTKPLWRRLNDLAPSLWRHGETYPRDVDHLEDLYAGGQVDFTMTYGPATLGHLVSTGHFPGTTRVLSLSEGTIGNASFLAIPSNAAHSAGAMVVANLAMSPHQQLAKARPSVWGQYTVLDPSRLAPDTAAALRRASSTGVVPPFATISRNAEPELGSGWVAPLEQGWRTKVLIH